MQPEYNKKQNYVCFSQNNKKKVGSLKNAYGVQCKVLFVNKIDKYRIVPNRCTVREWGGLDARLLISQNPLYRLLNRVDN